jgi:imidazoleglycerol-phosphate dehydratase
MKKGKGIRKTRQRRKTRETDITLELNLDGRGDSSVETSIPFMDHMLSLMCKHGLMDMKLKAKGDIEIDYHHTVEDMGIVLGNALREALKDMKGIRRYGSASVPMDEALASVSLDISGRPYLVYSVALPRRSKIRNFDADLVQDFLQALASRAGLTLHVNVPYGRNTHHILEAIFKALGRALSEAVSMDPRVRGVPSTKGRL